MQYPFTLALELHREVSQGSISCPSHGLSAEREGDVAKLLLEQDGMLDRYFILMIDGLKGKSFAVACVDTAGYEDPAKVVVPAGPVELEPETYAVLASFCPQLPQTQERPLRMKILVDCYGYMAGDSIHQARRAMHEVVTARHLLIPAW